MKEIKYKNKTTSANTVYCDVAPLDKAWVWDQCETIVEANNILKKHGITTLEDRRPDLPKQGTGHRNSIVSAAQGVLDNFKKSTQRDFSHKTRELISKTFDAYKNTIDCDFESVVWIDADNAIPVTGPGTTLGDFFDVESITVTYRRKG